MSAMDEEATQPATQQLPVHNGVAPSTVHGNYLAGVLCLLHPSSPAAYAIVEKTALRNPGIVLRIPTAQVGRQPTTPEPSQHEDGEDGEEQNTQLAPNQQNDEGTALDIALRLSPGPKDPELGFVFGRNPARCDVVLSEANKSRRVSNMHFRIYQNAQGVLMLHDSSTNGTWVDDVKLGGLEADGGKCTDNQRALFAGSVVHLAPGQKLLRFIVRIPTQDGTRLASERVPSPAGDESSIAGDRIEPGPEPHSPPPRLLPKHTRPPVRTHAAVLRNPFGTQGEGRHTAKAVKYNEYEGWDGGEKYKFGSIIGKGAFATVRRAIDRRTGDAYAVKSIQKRALAQSGDRQLGVRKEVEILEKLNHPNIVSYIDCHEDRSHIYIFMELIKGGDLSEYLERHGALPEPMVQEVSRQVLRGIEYVHSMGISHRDLKPDNILLACEDPIQVKISDFGLAKMVQNEDTFLKTFCGTMLFLAPEVFPGYANGRGVKQRRRYNQAVDMWSFGCVIFMLLTGSAPFQGKNQDDMLRIILSGKFDMTPLEKRLGAHSYQAKDFIGRLLQVNPGRRMMEIEALRHPWLADGSDELSMEVQEEDEGEEPEEEDDEEEASAISSFEKVEKQQERWMMVQGPDARPKFTAGPDKLEQDELSDNDEEEEDSDGEEVETPRREDLQDVQLRKAVTGLSFKGEIHIPAVRFDSGSSEGSFASLGDAESNHGSRRMFHPPPGISIQGSSGVFPGHGFSMFLDGNANANSENARQVDEGLVPSSQTHEPFEYDELRVIRPHRDARSGSNSRSVSGGSLSGAEAMVGKLKVHSPSPKETPSPTDGEFQQRQNQTTPSAATGNMDGNNDNNRDNSPTYARQLTPTPHQRSRHPSPQPDSFESQAAHNRQFAVPTTPWGRLIPMPGSIPHSTISLNKHQISIGRSANCTHTETDIRISKYHIAFQLSPPDRDVDEGENFQPANNMIAWYSVEGTNGVILNGKKKHKGRIGRIYDGDVVYLFKDCKAGGVVEYLGFRCEFSIGQHVRLVEELSDYEDEGFGHPLGMTQGSMATTMAVGTSKGESGGGSIDGVA
ncbi:kinase-like protein [Choiromyces venosus 120613-1]|uniref:Autophagy-related protein 1 n=1 Tax=Choiromyces venosus 120613-1 TaxID=1336337 RepID=A0A3N4IVQ7_9PEZI|nr:kinase-like protein [Choiromyces venosus 120613-1]